MISSSLGCRLASTMCVYYQLHSWHKNSYLIGFYNQARMFKKYK